MSKSNNQPNKALCYSILAVAVFGVLLTITIELSHIYPWIMELCGGSASSCSDVQSTPYAKIFGVSVAYWGLVSYALFILLLLYAPKFTLPAASVLMGAELYFMWVMNQALGMYCMFCLIQFATVVVLFFLTILWHWNRADFALPGRMWSAPVIVFVVFAVMVAPVKLRASQPPDMSSETYLTYAGDPNAKIRIELFSDYQCGHCKRLEPEIDKVMEEHPEVLLVFRDYIIGFHTISPVAVSYANAVAFTKGREEFVKTRSEMFFNQKRLRDYLDERLKAVEFTDELKKKIRTKVDNDLAKAKALDVYQTPTMVIYRGDDIIQIIRGYAKYERFARFLAS